MRFDDTLETVMAADLGSPQATQSAWRQLVDLIGRRRAGPDARAMATLRAIRASVPLNVRAASARALEFADPPAPLVRLFATDELVVALPVLRSARMSSSEWILLLPDLAPAARTLLRNRRDLGPVVKRALEAFGPIDFVLPDGRAEAELEPEPEPIAAPVAEAAAIDAPVAESPSAEAEPEAEPEPVVAEAPAAPMEIEAVPEPSSAEPEPEPEPPVITYWAPPAVVRPASPLPAAPEPIAETIPISEPAAPSVEQEEDFSFVALAGLAPVLPDLASEALDQSEVVSPPIQSGTVESPDSADSIAPAVPETQSPAMEYAQRIDLEALLGGDASDVDGDAGTFEIADVVKRIDAFWRHREETGPTELRQVTPGEHFRFETDSKGVLRWVEGVNRAALVGLSLDAQAAAGAEVSRIDGVAAGAFRRRAGFSNARLSVEGESDAAGDWLISAIPVFDPANGRFTGYRGTARRPRADERAEPVRPAAIPADSLRQLVHELRTPTNAIAGFAEMIESQMLGPVSDRYRERAGTIRSQARELLGAIDDLDLAARIDSSALALVPGRVTLRPVLAAIADDLGPLAELRGSLIALPIDDLAVTGDRRAVERLLARLLATLVSASGEGERIGVRMAQSDGMVAITIDRPRALADYPGDSVLGIDDEHEDITLLGTGFALRLARNLARELGGALAIEPESLTLRLPASENTNVGQAHLS